MVPSSLDTVFFTEATVHNLCSCYRRTTFHDLTHGPRYQYDDKLYSRNL